MTAIIIKRRSGVNNNFTPKDIPDLFAWYQDDSIFRGNSGSQAIGWADLSNNKNDALQSNSSDRPAFVFNQINQKSVIRFSSSSTINQLLTPNTGINLETSEFSFVVVAKISTPATGQVGAFITNRPFGQSTQWFSFGVANDTGTGNPVNKVLVERLTNAGVYNVYVSSYTPNNTWVIYSLIKQNNALNIFVNGSNVLSLSGVNTGGGTNTAVPWRIGNWFGNNQNLNGDIPFFCIYNKALSADEQSKIENYATSRYSL